MNIGGVFYDIYLAIDRHGKEMATHLSREHQMYDLEYQDLQRGSL